MGKPDNSAGIAITTMAMREEIMCYFKGTCVERMTFRSGVRLFKIPHDFRGVARYRRTEIEIDDDNLLTIANIPFAILGKSPRRIVFLTTTTERSPQFRAIKRGLRKFAEQYLPSVQVKQSKEGV